MRSAIPSCENLVRRSVVKASAETVWTRVGTLDGVNDEFFPYLRMTAPRALRDKRIDELPTGTHIGRSWLLLFGVSPVDFDDLTMELIEPGCRFREESMLFSMRRWTDERELYDAPGGCEIIDRLTYRLRYDFAVTRWIARRMLRSLFAHRHRRLAAWCESLGDGHL
jgi:ligand-binding SRPBCC domain-containing protein